MNCIENEIFYHIQRNGIWNVGDIHFIGRTKNPFVSYFDDNAHCIQNPQMGIRYSVNSMANEMLNYIFTSNKHPDFASFYHYEINRSFKELSDTLEYYLRLTREIVFEEVRKDFFPNLPSRHRCLWVIPDDIDNIKYWWTILGKKGRILKLKLTGKIHRANQQYLNLNTNRLNYIRQEAFKYWAGTSGTNKVEEECLFEGFAEVIEIPEPGTLGIQ